MDRPVPRGHRRRRDDDAEERVDGPIHDDDDEQQQGNMIPSQDAAQDEREACFGCQMGIYAGLMGQNQQSPVLRAVLRFVNLWWPCLPPKQVATHLFRYMTERDLFKAYAKSTGQALVWTLPQMQRHFMVHAMTLSSYCLGTLEELCECQTTLTEKRPLARASKDHFQRYMNCAAAGARILAVYGQMQRQQPQTSTTTTTNVFHQHHHPPT